MVESLHNALGPMPAPRPVCLGCRATDSTAVLTPIRNSKTFHLCVTCAGFVWIDAHAELLRRSSEALLGLCSAQPVEAHL